MRAGPSATALATSADWGCKVSSWLGATLLAESIPATGRAGWTRSRKVPETLELTIPRFSVEDGRVIDWLPAVDARAPLARFGQVLDVTIQSGGVDSRLGRYLLTEWQDGGDVLSVSATGMLQIPADDRLTSVTAPRDGGTLRSEFLRLLPESMQASFTGLIDRECPRAMEWPEDRLDALYEIADAWPARILSDPWGQVRVLPPLGDPEPVLELTDGEGGTVVSAPTSDSRERNYNRVVARSSATGIEAQAIAEMRWGPMSVSGPYGAVTKFFTSPLLLNEEQCRAAAETQLAEAVRPSRTLQVQIAPDPRIELDDAVAIVTGKGTAQETVSQGFVVGVDMPLTVQDGDMRIDVAIF